MRAENIELPENIVRNYILESVQVPHLDNNDDIFESGLVNSLFAIELMTFLEKAFQIKVTMDDLDMENFKSVTAVCSFVEAKRK